MYCTCVHLFEASLVIEDLSSSGLLKSLSGLNLTNNPLEFPPSYIVERGTQVNLLEINALT